MFTRLALPKSFLLAALLLWTGLLVAPATGETLLLRQPAISATHVAFVYAGDLWIAQRDGSNPRRLTVHPGVESSPRFSPDGEWIAFTGNYEGNIDVYVISSGGGMPYRLTYHPGADIVRGWTPDGTRVLFASQRESVSRYNRLFTVDAAGAFPEALPMPMAEQGAFDPEERYIAYTPIADATATWKRYRGGMMGPMRILNLRTYEEQLVPHVGATDAHPMWVADTVYFLSDRHRIRNLFAYEPATQRLRQLTQHTDFDVKTASAGPDAIVYEQAGRIHIYDLRTETGNALPITITADLPQTRPRYENVAEQIRGMALSPTGTRAVFEARGDIFTVPAKKGETRDLTRTPGVHERYPRWSPDGKWISYLSDVGGEYVLMMREQTGLEEPKVMSLGDATYYYNPQWSPDSKKLLYTDKRLNLFAIDIEKQQPVRIDTDTYDHPERTLNPVWSPCSRWIAYTKRLDTQFHAVFVYDLDTREKRQVTDGMSDCVSACFSRDGKYLFMTASTDFGLNAGWLDLSSMDQPVRRSIYVAVLDRKTPSPFLPESDDEQVKEEVKEEAGANEEGKKDEAQKEEGGAAEGGPGAEAGAKGGGEQVEEKEAAEKKVEKTVIDIDGIGQRIVALPVPPGNYSSLQSAPDGKLFYLDLPARRDPDEERQPAGTLRRFDMKERKSEVFMEGILAYAVSADGKKLLYAAPDNVYGIVSVAGQAKAGDGKLDLGHMDMYLDPLAEWSQIFAEAWRIERDFFYDAKMHGADWWQVGTRYKSWLPHVGHRDDLNYLLAEMIGELVVGHAYVGGGDSPRGKRVDVGLLGADFTIEEGVYRIKRIYWGENWNPDLRAPLTEPGVDVKAGDYILGVNGQPVEPPANLYAFFQNTGGRQTVLTVNSEPTFEEARKVTVVPIANDRALRHRAWIDDNRHRVEELSKGRVAYVYMPDTAGGGYTSFKRYYFAQLDRDGVVVDERFNGGGYVADIIIDLLDRPLLSFWATREGKEFSSPFASIYGPKVMIINEYAGSGGDAMPHFFRRAGLGKLVGKKTWGGLVGIYDYPVLIDGGFITAPRVAIYSPKGAWEVENEGVPPDIDVDITTKDFALGRDPQLERAVEIVLKELEAKPPVQRPRPAPPNRVAQ
ncbi:MAG: PDZ domain-containing protein [Planctomycetota bacterium]